MKDVSGKPDTFREATAEAFVAMPNDAQTLLRERRLDKGDALEIARAAGVMAAKRTSELIPFCHGILVTHAEVHYAFEADGVRVKSTVRALASTGVEMEALTGASLAALTLYDMLKPHTTELEIRAVRLLAKLGGKSDYRDRLEPPASVAVISLCGSREKDRAGKAIVEELEKEPNAVVTEYLAGSEGPEALRTRVRGFVESQTNIILTVGGTGLSSDDFGVDALASLIEREIPGVMEAARAYGQRRTPFSMLSRGVAGMIGGTLLVTFPGSARGARETYAALFPALLHVVHAQRKRRDAG